MERVLPLYGGEVAVEMEGEERRGRVEGKLEPRSVDVTLEMKRGENRAFLIGASLIGKVDQQYSCFGVDAAGGQADISSSFRLFDRGSPAE